MYAHVETGTDVAALAVGDVGALAALLDAPDMDVWLEQRDRAVTSGTLWRTETGADGSYLVGVYVDEEPGPDLARYLEDPIVTPRFSIPSGEVLVAGEECFIKPDFEHLELGDVIDLPAGEYSLTAYRGEYPDDLARNLLRETLSRGHFRIWSLGHALVLACMALTFVCVVLAIAAHALSPLGLAVIGWLGLLSFRRLRAFRTADGLYRELQRRYPSVVLVLASSKRD